MTYKVTITALEPNPNYEKEYEEAKEAERRWHQPYNNAAQPAYPLAQVEVRKLETVLTQAEFDAARKAILEVM